MGGVELSPLLEADRERKREAHVTLRGTLDDV